MEYLSENRLNLKTKIEEIDAKSLSGKDALKRSAEQSPEGGGKKRPVLGEITNNANIKSNGAKKHGKVTKTCKSSKSAIECGKNSVSSKSESVPSKQETEDSDMYITAIEGIDMDKSEILEQSLSDSEDTDVLEQLSLPPDVEDFDKSNRDPFSESRYAAQIFAYYKEREKLFLVEKYMSHQSEMNKGMRAILVDWMVEVQESFELNHETLYLAVKLVDRYLMHHFVPKAQLQLIGATATFVASKFDERIPPLVDDFLYICDDSYSREQLIKTEVKMLETVKFDLGIPLSYRFLRRYARCSRISMELLTLARYILETSLMDYDIIDVYDSKISAAALLLALKMKNKEWTSTLQYYSGYGENELKDLLVLLNKTISLPPSRHLQTIRTKYSHSIFFGVAKLPPLSLPKVTN